MDVEEISGYLPRGLIFLQNLLDSKIQLVRRHDSGICHEHGVDHLMRVTSESQVK